MYPGELNKSAAASTGNFLIAIEQVVLSLIASVAAARAGKRLLV